MVNMVLPEEQTIYAQLLKVIEEDNEFRQAIIKKDTKNAIEEYWDSNQSKLGALDLIGVPVSEVFKGYEDHMKKLKSRGHKFKEGDNIE